MQAKASLHMSAVLPLKEGLRSVKQAVMRVSNIPHCNGLLTCQHASLHCSSEGHHLIRVHADIGLLVGHLLHQLLHCWDTGGATHKDNLQTTAQQNRSEPQRLQCFSLISHTVRLAQPNHFLESCLQTTSPDCAKQQAHHLANPVSAPHSGQTG